MVADRHLDLIGEDRPDHGARKLRHMDLFMLRHQREAGERIVVLPTRERAKAPDCGVDDLEARAVALPPDHPLMERRRDLAALEDEATVGIEDELRVVERAVVALVDAEHNHDAVPLSLCSNRLGNRPGHYDGILVKADMLRAG